MKVFVFDEAKCNGCHNCQFACKDEHCDNEWLPYAKQQPETGQFWTRVEEETLGQGTKLRTDYRVKMCSHCDECTLVSAYPDQVYKREDGLVVIDPEKAAGNKDLVAKCPNNVVFWNEGLGLAQKCTGCAHLVDEGETPHCVDVCVTGALQFGDLEDFAGMLDDAEVMSPEIGPRFYRLNHKRLFAAGEVWDPVDDECLMGATVKLMDGSGNVLAEQKTDRFGDFWFDDLVPGSYKVGIDAEGFQPKECSFSLDTAKNLGDFAMDRA